MANILIEGHTDDPLLPNRVLSATPEEIGKTCKVIGEARLTLESMVPSQENWRKNKPTIKYDGMFKFVLDVAKREDIGPIADFLWYKVYAQSEATDIRQIGDTEVAEQSVAMYNQLLEKSLFG